MKFTKPAPNTIVKVTAKPQWPSLVFETDAAGEHTWHWTITWGTFTKSDKETTTGARKAHILCDPKTGNIGWDMNDAENKGKTEAELNKRDKSSSSKGRKAGANWNDFGVCYADRVLEEPRGRGRRRR